MEVGQMKMKHIYKAATLCYLATQFSLIMIVSGGHVPAVIVFGDSSVDSGNNNVIATVLKSNFRPYGRDFDGGSPTGRFSNGRVPPDFISEGFGLKSSIPAYLDPMYSIKDFATGVCFASAGTGYDNATSAVLNVIPLWKEMELYKEYQAKLRAYLGQRKADYIINESLYLISLGTNDFLENYYIFPSRRLQFTVTQYEDFLIGIAENFIRELHSLGARKISITGLVPIGCLPLERTTNILEDHACNEKYNNVALEFNQKLENLVGKLNRQLPQLNLVSANAYKICDNIIRRPHLYGFEVVEKACCSTGTFEMSYLCSDKNPLTCKDADKYVFWDAFHPTEKTNRIVADYLLRSLLLERDRGPKPETSAAHTREDYPNFYCIIGAVGFPITRQQYVHMIRQDYDYLGWMNAVRPEFNSEKS